MSGEFPVEMSTGRFFFGQRLSETPRTGSVHVPSSFASLDARAAARRISAFQSNPFATSFLNCGSTCPSVRRAHWRTFLPDRGPFGRSGQVARLHRSHPRRDDGSDAVLRPNARRGRETPQRLAGPGPRPRGEDRRIRLNGPAWRRNQSFAAPRADIEFQSCASSSSDSSRSALLRLPARPPHLIRRPTSRGSWSNSGLPTVHGVRPAPATC